MTLLILLCTGVILYFIALIMKFSFLRQVLPCFWITLSIGILILLLAFLTAFSIIPSNDDLKGFSGNVLAEGIGILVTVAIIDRLIRRHEENRWIIAKQLVYAKLLLIIDRPLEAMFHLFYRMPHELSFNIYYYGPNPIISSIRFDDDDISTLHSDILAYVEQHIEEHANLMSSIYDSTLLPTALDQIHEAITDSYLLIDPDLKNLLSQFEIDCVKLKRAVETVEVYFNLKHSMDPIHWFCLPHDYIDSISQQGLLTGYIEQSMRSIVNIKKWITSRADLHLTVGDEGVS